MQLRPFVTKTSAVFFLSLSVFSLFFVPVYTPHVNALTLEEQLEQIERDLAQINKNKQDLQSSISSQQSKIGQYSGEIGKLRAQTESLQMDISQLDLQIKEVEVNIEILNKQITEKKVELQTNEVHVVTLETESDARIQTNYMDYRIHKSNNVDFFTVKNANTYFKDSQYNEIIQDDTNKVLEQLTNLKIQMEKDKADLEEKSVKVERSKAMLEEQHSQLDRAEADLKSKMDGYYAAINQAKANVNNNQSTISQLSSEEAQKLGEREQVRQALFNSYNQITGQFIVAGTVMGYQGATGYAFGEHLHFQLQVGGQWADPCAWLPGGGGPVGGGCNGNGRLQWPMRGSFLYTSGFYDSRFYGIHAAVDFANYTSHAPIYASHDGWVCTSVDQYGAIYNVICENSNCNSGIKTGYWHMSTTLVQNHCPY